jgi:hypothetical protein
MAWHYPWDFSAKKVQQAPGELIPFYKSSFVPVSGMAWHYPWDAAKKQSARDTSIYWYNAPFYSVSVTITAAVLFTTM